MKRFLHASLFESKPKNFLFHWEKYEIIFPNMFFSYFRACIAYLSPKRLFSKRDSITLIYKGGFKHGISLIDIFVSLAPEISKITKIKSLKEMIMVIY